MVKHFREPEQWHIAKGVFAASIAEMARDGRHGNEGVALWFGRYEDTIAVITHVGILRGPGVRKAPALLMISSDLINELTDLAIENDVRLIGQIHSHGPDYGTDLSPTDRRYGVAVPGMLSLVAPDYAQRSDTTLEECGVHLFQPGAGWRRLPVAEIHQRLTLFDDAEAGVLAAGGDPR